MGASVTVTKTDDKTFTIAFSHSIPAPTGVDAGDTVPLEWIRAVLDYYNLNQGDDGTVPQAKIEKIKPCW